MIFSSWLTRATNKLGLSSFLRAFYTWVNISFLSVFFSSIIIIAFPFVYFIDKKRHCLHQIANIWAKSIEKTNPWWKFEINGRENLAENGKAVVYVANHQSQADILALFIIQTRFRWLSKESLFRIPFFGWAMTAVGYVSVNRASVKSGEKSMKLSAKHLRNGTPMIFFPEGTRSPDGELGAFKTGAFRLAKALRVPVVPITIKGCANLLPKGSIVPKNAQVYVTIHPQVPTDKLTPNEIMQKAREAIASQL